MARTKKPPPLPIAITADLDQYRWLGRVSAGYKPDGTPNRPKRTSLMCARCRITPTVGCACYEKCADKLRELLEQVATRRITVTGKASFVSVYLTQWLASRTDLGYGTRTYYSTAIRLYLIPHLGDHRLADLDRQHITDALATIARAVSWAAAQKAKRTLSSALSDAVKDRLVEVNEATLSRMPKDEKTLRKEEAVVPLSLDEAVAVLGALESRRNRARWLIALVHGHRQGECLAFAWSRADQPRLPGDIDLELGTLTVRESLQRRKWLHGCDDPHACGATPRIRKDASVLPDGLHKVRPCPKDCRRHKQDCPPPCPRNCIEHASTCPKRHSGGLVASTPKTEAGQRTVPLEPTVWAALREHKKMQDAEREHAGSRWVETGLVFTTPVGTPLDPSRDWAEWQAILLGAGVAPVKVHTLRHTAATFLLMQGVTGLEAMALMGWSQESLTKRYQHVVTEMKREAVGKVGSMLFGLPAEPGSLPTDPLPTEPNQDGSGSVVVPSDQSNVLPFRRKAG